MVGEIGTGAKGKRLLMSWVAGNAFLLAAEWSK